MNALTLLHKYLAATPGLYGIVYDHSRLVADKALSIASNHPEIPVNRIFLEEASLLHDIGVVKTNAPGIHCFGTLPYLCHGFIGYEILMSEGYPLHALVCERHIGTGLTCDEIIRRGLPLPHRDMVPVSLEEQLICFADLFYSKSKPTLEFTVSDVRTSLANYGEAGLQRFGAWCERFL